MKILIVGSDEVWSLEKHYAKYLAQEGVEIQICPVQSIFYNYYYKNIFNKILFKSGLSDIVRTIERTVKDIIATWQPDVVWVFKGMELRPAFIEWIKSRSIKIVNYNPDNPFIFSGKGSGNKNITQSIRLFDLHFTYDRDIQKLLEEKCAVRTAILPFGFELGETLFESCVQEQEIIKMCFLGNPDKNRAHFITALADSGINMDVYGSGWNRYITHKNVTAYSHVYGDDFWKTLRKYRVQLNLMRVHNLNSHNMRSIEVPAVGGIGLFPFTIDHAQFFENGKEIFLYKDLAECIDLSKTLLGINDEKALSIRASARLRSLQAGYSYRNRALLALQEIKKLVI